MMSRLGVEKVGRNTDNGQVSRILGLDPGSRYTGYGIVEQTAGQLSYLAHGVLESSSRDGFAQKITSIGQQLRAVLQEYQPDVVVLEKIFLGKNADSAFKLGHVRGVCIYEVESMGYSLAEYAARAVKKGVTGSGGASKEHVRLLIKNLMRIPGAIEIDASDALALAYHHSQQVRIQKTVGRLQL